LHIKQHSISVPILERRWENFGGLAALSAAAFQAAAARRAVDAAGGHEAAGSWIG
jgi:hypothetical protein